LLARSRGFRLFWGGRTVSLAGTQIARVALTVLVYRLGGGAAGISILLLAFTLPRLLGPLAGAIADRSDNMRLMVSCDLAQALLFAALAWVRWWPAVVVLVLIATLFATAYLPAGRGNIPLIVGRENLARANALLATGSNTALAVGPALGGILLAVGGPGLALIVNAGTFLLSALLTLGIPGLRSGTGASRASASGAGASGAGASGAGASGAGASGAGASGAGHPVTLLGQARLGLGDVWRNPVARTLAIMLLPGVGFASLDNAALIFLVRQGFHASAGTYAWVVTAFSAGMVGAPLAVSVMRRRLTPRALLFGGEGLFGVGTLATGLAPGLAAGIGAQLAAGAGNGMENIGVDTLLQESAPDERLGMVFGTVYAALYAGQIVAYAVATPVIVALGPRTTFVVAAVGVLAALAVLIRMLPSPGASGEQSTPS
jgi:predicted MFS family arabinose efflux permease